MMNRNDLEHARQALQTKLDGQKTPKERNAMGQYSTPVSLAVDITAHANTFMPKKGKLSKSDKEREYNKSFQKFRRQHAAVESAINCLEHHGLNRCPDKGITGFRRYTALGILAYNLHKLGNFLLDEDRNKLSKNEIMKKAA